MTIPAESFKDCENLTEVVFPEGAKYTYKKGWTSTDTVFYGCSSLGLKAKKAIQNSGYTDSF